MPRTKHGKELLWEGRAFPKKFWISISRFSQGGPGPPSVMGVSIIHWGTDLTLPQWSVGKPLFQLLKWTPEEIGPV